MREDVAIQPGRPGTRGHRFEEPEIVVVTDPGGDVLQTGRKLVLKGEWTLRQYRNPVPCGAHFALHPGPGATYEWKVLE